MMNFLFALIVAAVSASGGSLLWPRLTSVPRPQLLQQIHDFVIHTPMGTQAATVLGVADEANVEPLDGGAIVGGAMGALKDAVQKRAEAIIITQVTRQISQNQELRELICKPERQ